MFNLTTKLNRFFSEYILLTIKKICLASTFTHFENTTLNNDRENFQKCRNLKYEY